MGAPCESAFWNKKPEQATRPKSRSTTLCRDPALQGEPCSFCFYHCVTVYFAGILLGCLTEWCDCYKLSERMGSRAKGEAPRVY